MRRLLFRNSVRVESGNCSLIDGPDDVQPSVFSAGDVGDEQENQEISTNMAHLDSPNLKYYKENILVYISGYIVNKLIKKLTCKYCIKMLLNVKKCRSHSG